MSEQRIGELFCGAGGLGLGAHMANVTDDKGDKWSCTPVWGVDSNKWAAKTYKENLKAEVICEDVRDAEKVNFQRIKDEHGEINGFLFGFPCNDFSLAGEQKGLDGKYGPLYRFGVEALEVNKPDWFLAENVSGLASANDGRALKQILLQLQLAGYSVTPHLYRFEEYGVPQMRHRVIIVGIRTKIGRSFRVPAPTHSDDPTRGLKPLVGSEVALRGVGNIKLNNEPTRHPPKTIKFLSYIKPGQNAWTAAIPEKLKLKESGFKMSGIYRRLEAHRPAPTVTARGGGGTHGYHWAEDRALTNRERARLQTFPDEHEFFGPKEEIRAQVGMAVPPAGAKVIIEAILKCLAGIEYDCVPASLGHLLEVTAD